MSKKGEPMVLSTQKYEMFKKHVNNREISKDNLKSLIRSIEAQNMLKYAPIIVDKNYRIIDGQHRFEAAKALKLEIFYQIKEDSDNEDILLLNTTMRKWRSEDFLNFYINNNNEEYIKMFLLQKELGIKASRLISLLMGCNRGGDEYKKFRAGTYKCPNDEKIKRLKQIIEIIKNLKKLAMQKMMSYKAHIMSTRFEVALYEFLANDEIDLMTFCKKFELKIDILRPCTTRFHYHEIFKNMYNWKNANPIE